MTQLLTTKFTVKKVWLASYNRTQNKTFSIVFVDFKEAHNSIYRPSIAENLKNFGLHPKLVLIVELTVDDK